MGKPGTIGKSLNFGFAGSYARHPEMMIYTRPNDDTTNIVFGAPVMRSATGGVKNVDATLAMTNFIGVASREVKSALSYVDQLGVGGAYIPKEAVSVFERGSISVLVGSGTPAIGGAVYVRTVVDGVHPIGEWMAAEVTGQSVLIENAQWGGAADNRGIAELMLLRRANA